MAKQPNELIVLDRCKQQLATIKDLPTLLEVRDKAMAMANYLKTIEDGKANSNYAKSIVALAEARAGQTIKSMQEKGELAKRGQPKKENSVDTSLLSDLGVSHDDSARMQKAAAVLENEPEWFDAQLKECNEKGKDFTQQAVIRKGCEIDNKQIGIQKPKTPRGKYDVIVIDPPWPMQKIEREVRPNQSAFEYPTMSEDELAAMSLPAAEDCHLWCWTTHKFLPMALRLVPQWGFKYVCTFVWHKPGGFQPIGLPQYNCEFALYCRKGTPKFDTTKALNTCCEWPRGKHSEKPEQFYELLRRVTGGKRIDMFNRRPISGFKAWGNEAKVS